MRSNLNCFQLLIKVKLKMNWSMTYFFRIYILMTTSHYIEYNIPRHIDTICIVPDLFYFLKNSMSFIVTKKCTVYRYIWAEKVSPQLCNVKISTIRIMCWVVTKSPHDNLTFFKNKLNIIKTMQIFCSLMPFLHLLCHHICQSITKKCNFAEIFILKVDVLMLHLWQMLKVNFLSLRRIKIATIPNIYWR